MRQERGRRREGGGEREEGGGRRRVSVKPLASGREKGCRNERVSVAALCLGSLVVVTTEEIVDCLIDIEILRGKRGWEEVAGGRGEREDGKGGREGSMGGQ